MADNPKTAWWRPYEASGILVPGLLEYVKLEQRASAVRQVSTLCIPGLFQTEQYAEAILRLSPTSRMTDEEDRTLVRFRLDRQWQFFERQSPAAVQAVVDEAALLRQVGDKQVMYDQIVHLRKLADLSHVKIQVLPLGAPLFAVSMAGAASATLLSFSDPKEHEVLSLETPFGPARNMTGLHEVQGFKMEFLALQRKAMSAERTRSYLDDLAKRVLTGEQPYA